MKIVMIVLAAALVFGCDRSDRSSTTNTSSADLGDFSSTPKDVDLTANIRAAIVRDDSVRPDASTIRIVTTDGVVTLEGTVRTAGERNIAEKDAREVSGVKHVVNQLGIDLTTPLSR